MSENYRKTGMIVAISVTVPILAIAAMYMWQSKKKLDKIALIRQDSDRGPANAPALGLEEPLVIAMVGLPARGKSYLVKMLTRYLNWTGYESEVFNVGSYRRKVGLASQTSDFFDTSNANANKVREDLALAVQESMYEWLHESHGKKGRVAVFDATNTTVHRRQLLIDRAKEEGITLLFVESICDDQEVLERNYNLKLQNDDYKNMDPLTAKNDFMSRVKAYEKVYETVGDDEDDKQISYIKLINVGQKVITRNCHGYLPSQVAFYLQNVHIQPRKIFLSVIAESEEQSRYVSGRESGRLTDSGFRYTKDLAAYIRGQMESVLVDRGQEVLVLTGTTKIHRKSVRQLSELPTKFTPLLDELRAGDMHGLEKLEMKERYPKEYAKRMADKLNYRYPGVGGESYMDVIERIKPVIVELERQRRSIVVVCHVAVLRCIYAYFMGVPSAQLPTLDLLTHRVYELSPGPFGCNCEVIDPRAAVGSPSTKSTTPPPPPPAAS